MKISPNLREGASGSFIINQRTIRRPIKFHGIGVHSGENSLVEMYPAEADTGIIFIKEPEGIAIRATIDNIIHAFHSVGLGTDKVKVFTIEHLMAVLHALGIDNVYIHVFGEEIPILDGSAKEILDLVLNSGIVELEKVKKYAIITEEVYASEDERYIIGYPPDKFELSIDYEIYYTRQTIVKQRMIYDHSLKAFTSIAGAKTFIFEEDLMKIRKNGLGKGIIPNINTIIVGERAHEDLVTHKIIDLLGDLYLIGYPVLGKIRCYKGGHKLHLKFVKKLKESIKILKVSEIYGVLE